MFIAALGPTTYIVRLLINIIDPPLEFNLKVIRLVL